MAKHRDQGGCENFDGEPHTIAECRAMAERINKPRDWTKANRAGDEHGPQPHYHVTPIGSNAVFPVFFFTDASIDIQTAALDPEARADGMRIPAHGPRSTAEKQ